MTKTAWEQLTETLPAEHKELIGQALLEIFKYDYSKLTIEVRKYQVHSVEISHSFLAAKIPPEKK